MNTKQINYFLNNLNDGIYNWSFFSDFSKLNNITKYEYEFKKLNKLLNKTEKYIIRNILELIDDFRIRQALLLLIALKPKQLKNIKIYIRENLYQIDFYDIFSSKDSLSDNEKEIFMDFFRESGLLVFFRTASIYNLCDYCKGIEIGMDTNARKNRTGFLMENLCEFQIKKFCLEYELEYMCQVTKEMIEEQWGIHFDLGSIKRKFDFVIKDKFNNLTIVEVNYYNSNGSKIKATAKEYIKLNEMLNQIKCNFIWITDGKAWKSNKNILTEIPNNLKIMNIKFLLSGTLNRYILNKNMLHLCS